MSPNGSNASGEVLSRCARSLFCYSRRTPKELPEALPSIRASFSSPEKAQTVFLLVSPPVSHAQRYASQAQNQLYNQPKHKLVAPASRPALAQRSDPALGPRRYLKKVGRREWELRSIRAAFHLSHLHRRLLRRRKHPLKPWQYPLDEVIS